MDNLLLLIFSEKGEYSKLYDYLKSKKVKISGGTSGGKINWDDRAEDKGNKVYFII